MGVGVEVDGAVWVDVGVEVGEFGCVGVLVDVGVCVEVAPGLPRLLFA